MTSLGWQQAVAAHIKRRSTLNLDDLNHLTTITRRPTCEADMCHDILLSATQACDAMYMAALFSEYHGSIFLLVFILWSCASVRD